MTSALQRQRRWVPQCGEEPIQRGANDSRVRRVPPLAFPLLSSTGFSRLGHPPPTRPEKKTHVV
eukprot:scaffold2455_cov96-Isochrysis_galbana.AAC.1